MMKKGIDVSEWQGVIDWQKVIKNNNIDFVMLRAGYGKNNIDRQFKYNAGCLNKLGVPIGAYWFSYAHNKEMALNEAKYLISAVSDFIIKYPLCFDWEYDSYNYAVKNHVSPNKSMVELWATTFLNEIKRNNYFPCNYTNLDYYNKYFSDLSFDMWLAQWKVNNPIKQCAIWQYTDNGSFNVLGSGIDCNLSYIDYAKIYDSISTDKNTNINLDEVVYDVIAGKYGNGNKRKQLLEANGYNYNEVQKEVNKYITCYHDIIAGKYGNGIERKINLVKAGYNYDLAQAIVNYLLR